MESRRYPNDAPNTMGVRDSFTLNYIRTVPSPARVWKVAICGRAGSEIIVTGSDYEFFAHRGNDKQHWSYGRMAPSFNGIPMIGCETHLILAHCDTIELRRVEPVGVGATESDSGNLRLLSTQKELSAECGDEIISNISWGPDKLHFITCSSHNISVWKFDASSIIGHHINSSNSGGNQCKHHQCGFTGGLHSGVLR